MVRTTADIGPWRVPPPPPPTAARDAAGSAQGALGRSGATRAPLSACIISFQEEDRIEACIRSLAFCDEVVVVDSHSTDRTRELATAAGARVIERDWPGHVAQKE